MNLISISIGLATASLAIGYAYSPLRWDLAAVMALGILWLIGQYRGWSWIASGGLVIFTGAAAVGVWQGLPAGWMLLGSVATLATWDLDYFFRRLGRAGQIDGEDRLRRSHLRQLGLVTGLGLLAGSLGLSFQIQTNLGWAILLALLALIGFGRVLEAVRRTAD